MKFHLNYFISAMVILAIEISIALYIDDGFVRPYLGDFLVVILIYCFVKAFLVVSDWKAAIGVLLFSYLIELAQYLNFVKVIGLQKSRLANVVLGNSFAWEDLLAYTAGVISILVFEKIRNRRIRIEAT